MVNQGNTSPPPERLPLFSEEEKPQDVKEAVSNRLAKLTPIQRKLLAKRLRANKAGSESGFDASAPLSRLKSRDSVELSFAQERLWFLEQFEPGSPLYNVPLALRAEGPGNQEAARQALVEIVRRHDSLRTTISVSDERSTQTVSNNFALTTHLIDLTNLRPAERNPLGRKLAAAVSRRSFDLVRWPPVRHHVIKVGDEDHVILFSQHHIVTDGWSIGVLIKELATLYVSLAFGGTSPLPELSVQVPDYAVWQRQFLSAKRFEAEVDFWRRALADSSAVLELPTDRPRPAIETFVGTTYDFLLPTNLGTEFKALCQRERSTLFMGLVAVFNTLMLHLCNQEDVIVGSPIAGRPRKELEALIGFFVNTLVIRTNMSGNPSFSELLSRVRENTSAAYAHQFLPFEKLVEAIQPERNLSRAPLFQVMFVLQNIRSGTLQLPGLKLSSVEADSGISKFDLTLMIWDTADGLKGQVEYNTHLFDKTTIARWVKSYEQLLVAVLEKPSANVWSLPLLSDLEQAQLLVEWNDTSVSYLPDECTFTFFEKQAANTPDSIAAVFEDEHLTYGELNRRANQMAHRLIDLGVGPDTFVGLCVERSMDLAVTVLGILKSGGAYVALDPSFPQNRLDYILADTDLSVLVTGRRAVDLIADSKALQFSPDEDCSDYPDTNPDVLTHIDNLIYIIHTSGSTGKPKGVAQVHRPLSDLTVWQTERSQLRSHAKTLQYASLNFDISFQEMFSTWNSEGTIVLIPEELRKDFTRLCHFVEERSIERLFVPFVALRYVADAFVTQGVTAPALEQVITAGEQLQTTEAIRQFIGGSPHRWLDNQYGPTEAHVVSGHALRGDPRRYPALPPVGRPVLGAINEVVCEATGPVPPGVAAEIFVAGMCLSRGYLNGPQLVAAAFVPRPSRDQSGGRVYRTGDVARKRADGTTEFLGRADHQVKIRGFRIELGEIESVLESHVEVRDVICIAYGATMEEKRLAVYVAPETGTAPSVAELRRYVTEMLPRYMVPATFVMLDALPLMATGKVDRKRLPAPDGWVDSEREHVAPRSATEKALARIWAEVLKVESVGVDNSFFELGGHSLLATQVISRVRKNMGLEVPLRQLFEYPTVAGLATAIDQQSQSHSAARQTSISRALVRDHFPLSSAQERLWFLDQLDPNSPSYNLTFVVRATGETQSSAVQQAFSEIFRRHDGVRATFSAAEATPCQVIAPAANTPWPLVDLRGLEAGDRETTMRRVISEEARRPFSLSEGPLARGCLLRLDSNEHVVPFSMHHIVSDGWSIALVIEEFASLYEPFAVGCVSPRPEPSIQYPDFTLWQNQWLTSATCEAQTGYWIEQLAGAPPVLELPTDRPRPAVRTFFGRRYRRRLSQKMSQALATIGREHNATLFMVLLSAFQTLLMSSSGQRDVCVGTPIAGRNLFEIEDLIGFFVNTLVLRGDLSGQPTFTALLQRVREVVLGASANQDLPFERLVHVLNPDRSMSHESLFQVMLAVQNTPKRRLDLPELTLELLHTENDLAKFDVSLDVFETDDGLSCLWEYNTDLFDHTTIVRMADHLGELLKQIALDPSMQMSSMSLLSANEVSQIVHEWTDRRQDFDAPPTIQSLFEAQAARTPDAIAVVFGDELLTYNELNRQAEKVASYFADRGVAPDTMVSLCIERSLEMVIGLFGVLKAGAAYLPLSPQYPDARIDAILSDSGVALILTSRGQQQRFTARFDLHVDLIHEVLAADTIAAAPAVGEPHNLAYCMYTSGSTGKPKGTALAHAGLINQTLSLHDTYLVVRGVRMLQFAAISFDMSVEEIFPCLTGGGTLILRIEDDVASPADFLAMLNEQAVTFVNLPPAFFREILNELEGEALLPAALRAVSSGGEELDAKTMGRWLSRGGDSRRLINAYGPTETTVNAATWFLDRPAGADGLYAVPIGRGVVNHETWCLDDDGSVAGVGMGGSLHVDGVGVARGYLLRPSVTASVFIPTRWTSTVGSRSYNTHDVVRTKSTGELVFVGRADHQIKVRGFRVELGEIELALTDHPGVSEGVVITTKDPAGIVCLVAYYVGQQRGAPPVDELRKHLAQRLPDYMVPSHFVELDKIPLSANCKVDRKALPKPAEAGLDADIVAPRNDFEKRVSAIWAEVLGVSQVGVDINFFDLGGHSMALIRVHREMRREFQFDFPLRELFRYATVAAVARFLQSGVETEEVSFNDVRERVEKRRKARGERRTALLKRSRK